MKDVQVKAIERYFVANIISRMKTSIKASSFFPTPFLPQQPPTQLLTLLDKKPSHLANFMESQIPSTLVKLTMAQLILIHSPRHHPLLQTLALNDRHIDEWLQVEMVRPAQHFIRKVVLSQEQYQKVLQINVAYHHNTTLIDSDTQQVIEQEQTLKTHIRQHTEDYFNIGLLCYCVNSLKQLLNHLKKVHTLGRYQSTMHQPQDNISAFVLTEALQLTQLYFAMRFIIVEMAKNTEKYLSTGEMETLREIVREQLEPINQDVKFVMYNKYICPVDHNIRVPLLEVESQAQPLKQALQALTGRQGNSQKQQKVIKHKNRKMLRQSIFEGKKAFNKSAFEESVELFSSKAYQEQDLSTIILPNDINDENSDTNSTQPSKVKIKEKKDVLGERSLNMGGL